MGLFIRVICVMIIATFILIYSIQMTLSYYHCFRKINIKTINQSFKFFSTATTRTSSQSSSFHTTSVSSESIDDRPVISSLSTILPKSTWIEEATFHANAMDDLLYPKALRNSKNTHGEVKFKARTHAVPSHPIYNFLHSYYRYSPQELRLYSPGLGYGLAVDIESDNNNNSNSDKQSIQADIKIDFHEYLNMDYIKMNPSLGCLYIAPNIATTTRSKRYGEVAATTSRDILFATMMRAPHFGCFGLHEWAMLYSNNTSVDEIDPSQRHQAQLELRVSQQVIDKTVENTGLSCTHFDAWRFFHPAAQPLNMNNPMTRTGQVNHEQPACIHATMDLFKYAYQLYPFVSSDLLRRCLSVAVEARKIDMRASPYNVSHVEGCEEAICVETADGKLLYVDEQKKLFEMSFALRKELYDIYCDYLTYLK